MTRSFRAVAPANYLKWNLIRPTLTAVVFARPFRESHVSHSLKSLLNGGYIRACIGEQHRGFKGGY